MILLTNDDGIDAPGMQALLQAVQMAEIASPVAIVAPQQQQSGCGHQVTTAAPLQVQPRGSNRWAVAGTPVDCTRLALSHLCPEVRWILSGINAGGNMGSDIYISGTVAAVREAALHRLGAIAISHYRNGKRPYHWTEAARWTSKILLDLMQRPIQPGIYWNINLPHLEPDAPDPEIVFCSTCTQPLPAHFQKIEDQYHYSGVYNQRSRDSGSDVDVCLSGRIAIAQLSVNC
ncbi:MAG: 5'/3'-nucleotidase SurE [Synechococcales bacterium]|nr:5'/3'-nucleotidase SurE [Synechococcales bacterium]